MAREKKDYRVIHSGRPWFDFPYKVQSRYTDNTRTMNNPWITEVSVLTKKGALRAVNKVQKRDLLRGRVVWPEGLNDD